MLSQIAIGMGAGAASALLYFALMSGTALAFALFYLAPLPIIVAGLGWGATTGLVAALAGAVLAGIATTPALGLAFLLVCSAPAAWLARLALLGRPSNPDDPGSAIEWYPPERLILWTVGLGIAVVLLGTLTMGGGSEAFRESIATALDRLAEDEAGTALGLGEDVDLAGLAELFALVLPAIAAAVWTLTMLLNLWLGGRIAIASGQLQRPMPELTAMSFPHLAALAFAASIVLTFMPGLIGLAGSIATAAFLVAYFLFGLVVIHAVTRTMAGRPFLLAAVYLMVLFLVWTVPVIAALGLAETFLRLRARAGGGAAT